MTDPFTCECCGRTAGDDRAPCEACRGVQMEPDYDAMGNEAGMDDDAEWQDRFIENDYDPDTF